MCRPTYSLLPNRWQNRLLFSLYSSLFQKSLDSGELQLPSPSLGLKRYFWPLRGGSIWLGHLFWPPPPPPMTLTYLLLSIAPLAVAPLLTSPLLPLLLPLPAPGRCFRTWVLVRPPRTQGLSCCLWRHQKWSFMSLRCWVLTASHTARCHLSLVKCSMHA